MDKSHILKEIDRTAKEHNGTPLGMERFAQETGIRKSDWYGKYWAKWGDALIEAGYPPNKLRTAYDEKDLLEQVIAFVRQIGKLPTSGELRLKASNSIGFPGRTVSQRLGYSSDLANKIITYCGSNPEYQDVVEICKGKLASQPEKRPDYSLKESSGDFGYVYLMKSGRFYKIGLSDNVERRNYEIGIKLPEDLNVLHKIRTDDPAGIEAYWHNRFKDKRKQGKWFDLSGEDVSAFKRRFM